MMEQRATGVTAVGGGDSGGAEKASQKKKVPSDLIPSLLTTGMHGIERCDRERRTLGLSAPRWPVCPALGSKLPGAPQPVSLPNGTGRS